MHQCIQLVVWWQCIYLLLVLVNPFVSAKALHGMWTCSGFDSPCEHWSLTLPDIEQLIQLQYARCPSAARVIAYSAALRAQLAFESFSWFVQGCSHLDAAIYQHLGIC